MVSISLKKLESTAGTCDTQHVTRRGETQQHHPRVPHTWQPSGLWSLVAVITAMLWTPHIQATVLVPQPQFAVFFTSPSTTGAVSGFVPSAPTPIAANSGALRGLDAGSRSITRHMSLMPEPSSRCVRTPVVGGNWKCNGNRESVQELVKTLNDGSATTNVEVVVAPPALYLDYVVNNLRRDFHVASQDSSHEKGSGAFTGELTASMLKEFGLNWAIVGHSERRHGFGMQGETEDVVARKVELAVNEGMSVIACVGENLQDREAGKTLEIVGLQLQALANRLQEHQWGKVVLAYEPVWAIGTGVSATPKIAGETHQHIRLWMAKNVSPQVASNIRILYGGSVKAENAEELMLAGDVDGFLVGGASLNPQFLRIVDAAAVVGAKQLVEL